MPEIFRIAMLRGVIVKVTFIVIVTLKNGLNSIANLYKLCSLESYILDYADFIDSYFTDLK